MSDYFLPLKRREEVAQKTMAFWFDRGGTDYNFQAGQHAKFTIDGQSHWFSIASSPLEKDLMITTRMRQDSDYKNRLKTISIGTRIKVSPAVGNFALHKDSKIPAVMVAGGIGITPMRSMIMWVVAQKLPRQIFLFYANPSPEQAAFLEEFRQLELEHTNFKLVPIFGRFDIAVTKPVLNNPGEAIYYIAGPPGMVGEILERLREEGVASGNIKTEEFGGY